MAALTENFQLKWHSFSSHLHSCVAKALAGDAFCDVSLVTIDGHHILAHRFVLSACSQYLQQVLKLHQRITTTLPLLIVLPPQIDYKTMKTLLQYMYRGETTVSKDILDSVLKGGDLLKVRGLWRPKEDQPAHKSSKEKEEQLNNFVNQLQPPPLHAIPAPDPNKPPPLTKIPEKKSEEDEEKTAKESNEEEAKEEKESTVQSQEDESSDNSQFLVIKEEPIEWTDFNGEDMVMVDGTEMFHTEMTIKPEVFLTEEKETEQLYSPLTCELCSETFTLPGEWVRHIQTHTDMLPAKRQRRGRLSSDEENGTFPPLHCDLCQESFSTPAEWVRHIQSSHTDFELKVSNRSSPSTPSRASRPMGSQQKVCNICNKKFPSHASMLIHKRTHTGEKPYMCNMCHKGFNVKSNLLRHLRTLHDKLVNSTDVESKEYSPDASTTDDSG